MGMVNIDVSKIKERRGSSLKMNSVEVKGETSGKVRMVMAAGNIGAGDLLLLIIVITTLNLDIIQFCLSLLFCHQLSLFSASSK